jgi:hypothetical protein
MALFYSSFALLSLVCVRWLARREAAGDFEERGETRASVPQRLSSAS